MQALLDYDDWTPLWVIETGNQGSAEPVDDLLAHRLRHHLLGFLRIVHDDEVAAASGERAAHGSRITPAASGRNEFGAGVLGDAHLREQRAKPAGIDDHAELPVELGGELVRVAHHDDAAGRVVSEPPSNEGDRNNKRLERAR